MAAEICYAGFSGIYDYGGPGRYWKGVSPEKKAAYRKEARAALSIAAPILRNEALEEAATILEEECQAMLSQRDEIIGNGTLGNRPVPQQMAKGFARERKVLAEGYESCASAIRYLKTKDKPE
jgi:hypothetical protein